MVLLVDEFVCWYHSVVCTFFEYLLVPSVGGGEKKTVVGLGDPG